MKGRVARECRSDMCRDKISTSTHTRKCWQGTRCSGMFLIKYQRTRGVVPLEHAPVATFSCVRFLVPLQYDGSYWKGMSQQHVPAPNGGISSYEVAGTWCSATSPCDNDTAFTLMQSTWVCSRDISIDDGCCWDMALQHDPSCAGTWEPYVV